MTRNRILLAPRSIFLLLGMMLMVLMAACGSEPSLDSIASVSAALSHTCVVRTDETLDCWGKDLRGETSPPEGPFTSVSAGRTHTCGVRTDQTVECWGWDGGGKASPPNGEFASVSAGGGHTCGVRTDGSIECWGLNDDEHGRTSPPQGQFTSVNAGLFHTCAVSVDGNVVCWGIDRFRAKPVLRRARSLRLALANPTPAGLETMPPSTAGAGISSGQATSPEGEFTSISVRCRPRLRYTIRRHCCLLGWQCFRPIYAAYGRVLLHKRWPSTHLRSEG